MSAKLPAKYRYIVVEGPVGAGKTSLARVLGERAGEAERAQMLVAEGEPRGRRRRRRRRGPRGTGGAPDHGAPPRLEE